MEAGVEALVQRRAVLAKEVERAAADFARVRAPFCPLPRRRVPPSHARPASLLFLPAPFGMPAHRTENGPHPTAALHPLRHALTCGVLGQDSAQTSAVEADLSVMRSQVEWADATLESTPVRLQRSSGGGSSRKGQEPDGVARSLRL